MAVIREKKIKEMEEEEEEEGGRAERGEASI